MRGCSGQGNRSEAGRRGDTRGVSSWRKGLLALARSATSGYGVGHSQGGFRLVVLPRKRRARATCFGGFDGCGHPRCSPGTCYGDDQTLVAVPGATSYERTFRRSRVIATVEHAPLRTRPKSFRRHRGRCWVIVARRDAQDVTRLHWLGRSGHVRAKGRAAHSANPAHVASQARLAAQSSKDCPALARRASRGAGVQYMSP